MFFPIPRASWAYFFPFSRAPGEAPASRRQESLPQLLVQVLLSCTRGLVWVVLILNHAVSGSLLSLPYPIACFCYGALESPQPNKIFFLVLLWCARRKSTPVCSALVPYLPYISLVSPLYLPYTSQVHPAPDGSQDGLPAAHRVRLARALAALSCLQASERRSETRQVRPSSSIRR